MKHARPQARQIREREQAKGSPQLRLILVREQSASAFSPRQQARQQSVRGCGKAALSTVRIAATTTDADTPRSDRDSVLAAVTAKPLTSIGRESEQAANCPDHCIAVVFSSLIHFPVHIRSISHNVLI